MDVVKREGIILPIFGTVVYPQLEHCVHLCLLCFHEQCSGIAL